MCWVYSSYSSQDLLQGLLLLQTPPKSGRFSGHSINGAELQASPEEGRAASQTQRGPLDAVSPTDRRTQVKQPVLSLGKNVSTCRQITALVEFSPRWKPLDFCGLYFPPSGTQVSYQCNLLPRSSQRSVTSAMNQQDARAREWRAAPPGGRPTGLESGHPRDRAAVVLRCLAS